MPTNLATGLSAHPISVAQLGDVGLIVNGHDPNKVFDLRAGTLRDLGIAAPSGGPFTATPGAAGNVNGTVRYRIRWYDSITQTMSLPSAEVTVSTSSLQVTIDKTAMTAPASRVTHWIVERTQADGSVFYPLNRTSSLPNGTAIGTATFVDNEVDSTISERDAFTENQGRPNPFPIVFANGAYLHGIGGRIHRPTCSCSNGSPNVSSADGDFTQDMVGENFSFDEDTDGVTYVISSVTNANNLVLASNYAGATKTSRPASIAGVRNLARWCEANDGESWGYQVVTGLSNEALVGDSDGLLAGIGLGTAGVLYAKWLELWMHSYQLKPNPSFDGGDGRIFKLGNKRGALNRWCLKQAAGRIYGADCRGVWRMDPPGEPVEIGGEIQEDWRQLDFSLFERFHMEWDPQSDKLKIYACEVGDTYPKRRFVYDLAGEKWVGRDPFPAMGYSASVRLPDLNGNERLAVYNEKVGSAGSYVWFDEIGNSLGAPPDATPLVGEVASGSNTTATVDGPGTPSFPTSGEKLKGIPVLLIRVADGTQERSVITDNTSDTVTFNALTGPDPADGDTLIIGPIESTWRTGRWAGQDPEEFRRKKIFQRLWVLLETDADAVNLKVRAYYDGSGTADSDKEALNEDGLEQTASKAPVIVKPANGQLRYGVPLNGKRAFDASFEIYSQESGVAWKVLGALIEYDVDDSEDPRRV